MLVLKLLSLRILKHIIYHMFITFIYSIICSVRWTCQKKDIEIHWWWDDWQQAWSMTLSETWHLNWRGDTFELWWHQSQFVSYLLLTEKQINVRRQLLWSSCLGQTFLWTVYMWLSKWMLMHIWACKSTFFKKNCVLLTRAMQLGINEDVSVASGETAFFCLFSWRR